jgi:hypothetical protein
MDGLDLRERIRNRGDGYRCIVEAVIDHKECPEDPKSKTILKGQQGIAYDFWNYMGYSRIGLMAVDWRPQSGCNYEERYNRKGKITRSITEIKFVRELKPKEHCMNPICACSKK